MRRSSAMIRYANSYHDPEAYLQNKANISCQIRTWMAPFS